MNYVLVFILNLIVWYAVTWNFEPANLLAGALVSAFVTAIFGKEFPYHPKKAFQVKRYIAFIKFLLIFLRQMFKANIMMAYRVLSPGPPIKPGVVKMPLYLKSSLGRTIMANSITLSPGTFTMDITEDFLYIHWIYVVTEDPAKTEELICGNLQKILKEVFE